MKSYNIKIKSIIVTTSLVSIVVFSAFIWLIYPAEIERLGEILLHYGFIILPATFLWVIIENYFWHLGWFQKLFRTALNIPPDMRGRWEGKLIRDEDQEAHSFVIEVHQTLTKLQVYTFADGGKSRSESYFANITSDEMEKKFTLCYLWYANASAIPNKNIPMGSFYGFSMLELNEEEDSKELTGTYFTDRLPQTKGIIEIKWVGRKRRGKQ